MLCFGNPEEAKAFFPLTTQSSKRDYLSDHCFRADCLAFPLTILLSVKYLRAMSEKNPHAVALGKLGGKARAQKTMPEQRKAWARRGGLARAKRHSKEELSKWAKMGGRPPRRKKGGRP